MTIHEAILRSPLIRRARANRKLRRINAYESSLSSRSIEQLRETSHDLRFRAKMGERPEKLVVEAFSLVREVSDRVTGMRHFDVQILAGIHLASKCIVEMATGEGKTLTALLPMYLHGLYGKGAHLATANDYLARRDGETMQPVFETLGLSVGIIQRDDSDADRRRAYGCDVTYGTSTEFGFDFLRDRMKRRVSKSRPGANGWSTADDTTSSGDATTPVCRKLHFILVDEADSVMIDDASTPLIIGAATSTQEDKKRRLFHWAAEHASDAREGVESKYIEHRKKVELTERGRLWVRERSAESPLPNVAIVDTFEYIERAIQVERDYRRDRNYVIADGEVTIVDNNTGRLAVGRYWQDGIHQAIQAREGLEITVPTASSAQLTIQSLILSYPHRAGMTGTARSSRREFRRVYKLGVVRIPTRLPSRRSRWRTVYCSTQEGKLRAIRDEVAQLQQDGRPVLIGSRSVVKSELLSELFSASGIDHQILNADVKPMRRKSSSRPVRPASSRFPQAWREGALTLNLATMCEIRVDCTS